MQGSFLINLVQDAPRQEDLLSMSFFDEPSEPNEVLPPAQPKAPLDIENFLTKEPKGDSLLGEPQCNPESQQKVTQESTEAQGGQSISFNFESFDNKKSNGENWDQTNADNSSTQNIELLKKEERVMCIICRKKFGSGEALGLHKKLSNVHKVSFFLG